MTVSEETREQLNKLGIQVMEIKFTPEEIADTKAWREAIETHGQELWRIYHWIVFCQKGRADGIYRLRDWLQTFNIPDHTGGEHFKGQEIPEPWWQEGEAT